MLENRYQFSISYIVHISNYKLIKHREAGQIKLFYGLEEPWGQTLVYMCCTLVTIRVHLPIQDASSLFMGITLSFSINCGKRIAENPDVIPEHIVSVIGPEDTNSYNKLSIITN